MNMNWFESLIYGLISGLAEFLPISSQAHQSLLMQLFGVEVRDPVRDLFVHLALLFALFSGCRSTIGHIRREQKQRSSRGRYRRGSRALLDMRLIKNAAIPMLIGMLIVSYSVQKTNLVMITVFLLINGVILFIPERMMQGNKDARGMSAIDSFLIGISGALSSFYGISRVGATTSTALARGADRQCALNWALLLSIPALVMLAGLDVLAMFGAAGGLGFWGSLLTYILSATGAYCGGYASIAIMKFLTVRTGYSIFAYYSWGAALFTFLLYLTVV